MEPEVRRANGNPDGLIRLSVCIEDARDLIRDLDQVLDKVVADGDSSRAEWWKTLFTRDQSPKPTARIAAKGG